MTLLISVGDSALAQKQSRHFCERLQQSIKAYDAGIPIVIAPDEHSMDEVTFACVWKYPYRLLKDCRQLRGIQSLGAGVDFIVSDPYLSEKTAIARVVDRTMQRGMTQYLLHAVIEYHRSFDKYRQYQQQGIWEKHELVKTKIGIMGLGYLGMDIARVLVDLGYDVVGWSRTKKTNANFITYSGTELNNFIGDINLLICLLPLTDETKGILCQTLFDKLRRPTYLINVARGEHLVEQDLLYALDKGKILGAKLDVFREEPLPSDHPFWSHPNITISPHISAETDLQSCVSLLVENYHRACNNQSLRHQVDRTLGY